MKYNFDELLQEFYLEHKDKYSLNKKEMRTAITAPYEFFIRDLKEFKFTSLRILYFGIFRTTQFRAKSLKKKLEYYKTLPDANAVDLDRKIALISKYIDEKGNTA